MYTHQNCLDKAVPTSTHNLCFEQKYGKYKIFLSENFYFLEMKISIHLNRHVFIMQLPVCLPVHQIPSEKGPTLLIIVFLHASADILTVRAEPWLCAFRISRFTKGPRQIVWHHFSRHDSFTSILHEIIYTVNLLYTNTRYNDQIPYKNNLNVRKPSLKRWQLMRNYARILH